MSNLTIDVNVNPNGVASPTQTKVTTTPESEQTAQRTASNPIKIAAISSIAQRGLNLATANIGAYTGSGSLQRRVQFATQVANIGITTMLNPIAGAVAAATQLTSAGIQLAIENRNTESEIRYNQTLRSATFNNSRR